MKVYKTKSTKISGANFREVHSRALKIYKPIKSKTKRRPYIRSAYFKNDKIFLEFFWQHLFTKENWRDRMRRLKYFSCGLELIQNSKFDPESKENPNKKSEILHRFAGTSKDNDLFFLQIKESKKTGQKWLISIFPLNK
jgi:hypothetical protein